LVLEWTVALLTYKYISKYVRHIYVEVDHVNKGHFKDLEVSHLDYGKNTFDCHVSCLVNFIMSSKLNQLKVLKVFHFMNDLYLLDQCMI